MNDKGERFSRGIRTGFEHHPDFVEYLFDDQYSKEKAKDDSIFVQHFRGDDDVQRPLDGIRQIEIIQ